MKACAEKSIEECVSRGFVLCCRWFETAVVNGKMTLKTELGCDGSDLALANGLNDTTRHNRICARCDSVV